MARDILTIPISTVASESTLSTFSRIINDCRCSTTPETVETLICTQSWISSDPPPPAAVSDKRHHSSAMAKYTSIDNPPPPQGKSSFHGYGHHDHFGH
ncbi:hypothetical protein EJ110_NYTH55776 [Nymphaea thermarum]|nr:hypothetical protein EJ110_NYTH55776 [Nymphaea thermarum]